jgi:thiamine pyrophosphokinase
MLNFKNYASILCLNSDLPNADFFQCNLPIIAADGAVNRLAKINIKPSIVIGDLDSADPALLTQYDFLHLPSQETSDYQKCLSYLTEHQLLPTIVTGVNGGCLDHILNNVNLFLETNSLLYAPPTTGFCVRTNKEIQLPITFDSKISLFGIPRAIVTTNGLKWELEAQTLCFPGKNSCFNRTQKSSVDIKVHEGQLLVLVYNEPTIDAASSIAPVGHLQTSSL